MFFAQVYGKGGMISMLRLGLLFVFGIGLARADDPIVNPNASPEQVVKELSAALRDGIRAPLGSAVCELKPGPGWAERDDSRPSVILVPGLFGGEDSLARISSHLQRQGIAVAFFRYADQRPVDVVADGLSRELAKLRREEPERSLCLVTHSLGGLVARAAIEAQGRSPECVKGLVMIAPPNHGSALAELSATQISDVAESLGGEPIDFGLANELIDGVIGEAKASLRSDSPFLAELNRRPRAPGVRYTTIAGTGAPIDRDLVELPLQISSLLFGGDPEHEKAMAPLRRLLANEEWMRGYGDGVVSVRSARLEGVADFHSLPFTHNDFGDAPLDPPGRRTVDAVAELVSQRVRQAFSD
jgi:hypothetical protein